LVQATKDPIGHKGARLTSQVSLPGRYLVYVPGSGMTGISRKLPDTERARLKQILKKVMPENAGVIVRTAAEGAAEEELAQDVARLSAQWEAIEQKAKTATAPELLYSEPDLTIRVVRDIFNEDFASLVIASDSEWDIVADYVHYVAPHLSDRLRRWDGDQDVFAAYRIDEQIAKALDRKVWLPSGGSLVIDATEAMTVIDVNTGKFTGHGGNLEQTVTRNNLEAAEEIVRQLRVRDVGGIIVIDFIDMVLESNRDLVLRRLLECLARDRTKHQVAEVTSLGLVQMTRKRVGAGLLEAFSVQCEHCNGRGVLISLEPVDHTPAISPRGRSGGDDRQQGDDGQGRNGRRGGSRGSGGSGRGRKADQPVGPGQAMAELAARSAARSAADAEAEIAEDVADLAEDLADLAAEVAEDLADITAEVAEDLADITADVTDAAPRQPAAGDAAVPADQARVADHPVAPSRPVITVGPVMVGGFAAGSASAPGASARGDGLPGSGSAPGSASAPGASGPGDGLPGSGSAPGSGLPVGASSAPDAADQGDDGPVETKRPAARRRRRAAPASHSQEPGDANGDAGEGAGLAGDPAASGAPAAAG
jgi:ribonuclease E